MNSNWDKYLDPPDEPEEVYCESCGAVMVDDPWGEQRLHYMRCPNKYCPDKHTGVAREIAEELADMRATRDDLLREKRFLLRIIREYDPEFEY